MLLGAYVENLKLWTYLCWVEHTFPGSGLPTETFQHLGLLQSGGVGVFERFLEPSQGIKDVCIRRMNNRSRGARTVSRRSGVFIAATWAVMQFMDERYVT